jgi:ribosomal-protein-alanine N-acetyltransferase
MKKIKICLPSPKELISLWPALANWSQNWDFWPIDEVLKSLLSHGCFVALATENDQVIGFVFWRYLAGEGELLFIFVPEAGRGGGVARQLLEWSLVHLKTLGVKAVFLEVRPSNTQAIRLYEASGFNLLSTRKHYYKDGEDAQVFTQELA